MKEVRLFRALCAIALLLMAACAGREVEYRSAMDDGIDWTLHYKITTEDGKRLWGLVENHSEKMPEYEITRIPCVFDSIFCIHSTLKDAYVCMKDGVQYAYDRHGYPLWGDGRFYTMEAVGKDDPLDSHEYDNSQLVRFAVDGGYMFVFYYGTTYDVNVHGGGDDQRPLYYCLGPYEHLYYAKGGFCYCQDGKWGLGKTSAGQAYGAGERLMEFSSVTGPVYDAIIAVEDHSKWGTTYYWLVKVGGEWTAIDDEGAPKRLSSAYIRSLLSVKPRPLSEYGDVMKAKTRVGGDTVGRIYVRY